MAVNGAKRGKRVCLLFAMGTMDTLELEGYRALDWGAVGTGYAFEYMSSVVRDLKMKMKMTNLHVSF
jgi:hypothetical protein